MRYVEFTVCGQQISNSDFAEVETRLSIPLPVGLKEHYQKYNGGVPERQCWEYLDGEY
ncbi:MAG: SMI1/KNR4 family protein [Cytophagaceae bacterium]|nr:MAG: SMI1/KNR4 family protein [Cytophagaceae bacterium]